MTGGYTAPLPSLPSALFSIAVALCDLLLLSLWVRDDHGPCVTNLLWEGRYLFSLTVTVCLMFLSLLVWTETYLRRVQLCVTSNHNIKVFLHRGDRFCRDVLINGLCDIISRNDDSLHKYPNRVPFFFTKRSDIFLIFRCAFSQHIHRYLMIYWWWCLLYLLHHLAQFKFWKWFQQLHNFSFVNDSNPLVDVCLCYRHGKQDFNNHDRLHGFSPCSV